MRGVLHVWGFFASLIALAILLFERAPLPVPAMIFALSVTGLLGTSALYHRVRWSAAWYPRIRRVDHAMIFVLIMGSYAPLFAAVAAHFVLVRFWIFPRS
jgi:hemolysin III